MRYYNIVRIVIMSCHARRRGYNDGRRWPQTDAPGCRHNVASWSGAFITIIVVCDLQRRGENVCDGSVLLDFRGIPVPKSDIEKDRRGEKKNAAVVCRRARSELSEERKRTSLGDGHRKHAINNTYVTISRVSSAQLGAISLPKHGFSPPENR